MNNSNKRENLDSYVLTKRIPTSLVIVEMHILRLLSSSYYANSIVLSAGEDVEFLYAIHIFIKRNAYEGSNSSAPKVKANFNVCFCSYAMLCYAILYDYLKELLSLMVTWMTLTDMLLNERTRQNNLLLYYSMFGKI